MENKMVVFENDSFGNIEVLNFKGVDLFRAKDVGNCLEIDKTTLSKHLKNLDEDEVFLVKNSELHNNQHRKLNNAGEKFITESGIYYLVGKSRKSSAKEFSRWVRKEVLPTMRKTGGYISNDEVFLNTYFPNVDEQSKVLFRGILEQVRISNEKIKKQQQELVQKQEDIIELEGEVEVWENMFGQKDTYGFDELAKIFANEFPNLPNGKKTGRNNFFQYLRNDGVLRHNNTPYQTYSHHFKLIPHEYGVKTVIKNDGIKWLMKRIKKQF